jgi:hypothetical protein
MTWREQACADASPGNGRQVAPDWHRGIPHCDHRCPYHDGKRCELTGFRPGTLCEPVVVQMAAKLQAGEP